MDKHRAVDGVIDVAYGYKISFADQVAAEDAARLMSRAWADGFAAGKAEDRKAIYCAHPTGARAYCGPGWICERDKGGCGATGSGDKSHWEVVTGYVGAPK